LIAGHGAEVALHLLASQVEVAVAEAHGLVGLEATVEWEGQQLGAGEHLDRAFADLDRTGGEAVLGEAPSAKARGARHLHDVLAGQDHRGRPRIGSTRSDLAGR
jgi:hypothetical protein